MFSIAPRFARRLAKVAFGGFALGLAALSGASAQYYPPGYYGGPPQGYYRGGPPQGYDDGYYRPRRRVAMGSVCVTARGDCGQRNYAPIGSRCFCIIPGFGKKHGEIQY
jgi:hypothetical protein